jgi:RimK family alpha-L-glutamate ligase
VKIVIFAEVPDWHCRRLAAALGREGASVVIETLRACRFRLGEPGSGVDVPALRGALPDAAIVRAIPSGSFEQVTFRLSLLHALRELGIPVVNDARAIERCVDKSMTSFLLHKAGIPIPPTVATEDAARAADWRAQEAGDVVVKPLFGAQGRGLLRLARADSLPEAAAMDGVFYLQRYVGRDGQWQDYRVFVVGEEPVAAMRRQSESWITNVAQGGACESVPCRGRLAELAAAASRAVGAAYAGVDLIETPDGALMVLEVNSMPAWTGLQSVTETDIAAAIAAHVVRA